MKITLQGEFTTLNEYIDAERTNRYAAAELKKTETMRVKLDTLDVAFDRFSYPLDVTVVWYRANRRSDPDNVSAAIKFILDGLQHSNIIEGDGWKHINSICHVFEIDKNNPRVEIHLESVGKTESKMSNYYPDGSQVDLFEQKIDF